LIQAHTNAPPAFLQDAAEKEHFLRFLRAQLAQQKGWDIESVSIWIEGDAEGILKGSEAASDATSHEASRKLCAAGCGAFGEDARHGYCGKCDKDQDHRGRSNEGFKVGEQCVEFIPTKEAVKIVAEHPSEGGSSFTVELPDGFQRVAAPAELRRVAWGEGARGFRGFFQKAKNDRIKRCKVSQATPKADVVAAPKPTLQPALQPAIKSALNPTSKISLTPVPKPTKSTANRCPASGCRKKLKLSAISCACGLRYCSAHRYPEQHDCPFDFQRRDREKLRKENQMAVRSKMHQGGRAEQL